MSVERLKILLIEHDTAFAQYTAEMIGQVREIQGELQAVGQVEQGWRLLAAEPFDVVLLDLAVPDGAGLGNIGLLRGVAPQVPVVACGDAADELIALEAVHEGAEEYLVKSHLTSAWLGRSLRYAIERHRMDMALLAAEERYHNLFDHLVEGIFQTTPDGQYLLANQALARIYGYSNPEELKLHLTDIGRRLYVDQRRRDEFVRLMQGNDTIAGFESQVYRRDGTIIWISENCRAVRDASRRLLYYEGTVEDVSQRREAEDDRRRTEARLRESETLYHSLVETLPQNIFRKGLDGRFTFANQKFCETLKVSAQEILGKTDFDFYPRELAEKYRKDDQQLVETGEPYDQVEENQPPGQPKMYVKVVKTLIRDSEGKPLGIQGIFWDITKQWMAEERVRRVNGLLAASRRELRARKQQMEEDLRMAREIQLTMLPQQYPPFAGIDDTNPLQFTHRYLPTGSVGGDFFSISAPSETEAAVFVCDVAGHGVRSALVTAMIRALVEELSAVATDPGKFLTKLNSDLYAILKHTGTPMLTTAFYMVADWKAGTVCYANAGHPKPLHLRRAAGKLESLMNVTGKPQPALGLFEAASYTSSKAALEPEDMVMVFTDGLYEVQGRNNELYTRELLVQGVARRLDLPVGQLFDELLEEISQFSAGEGFTDDVCLVGMDFKKSKVAPSSARTPK